MRRRKTGGEVKEQTVSGYEQRSGRRVDKLNGVGKDEETYVTKKKEERRET